jgi:predicted metalloprotease with PDZ domain
VRVVNLFSSSLCAELHRAGVRVGDFLIAINNVVVAFSKLAAVSSSMVHASTVSVVYARHPQLSEVTSLPPTHVYLKKKASGGTVHCAWLRCLTAWCCCVWLPS